MIDIDEIAQAKQVIASDLVDKSFGDLTATLICAVKHINRLEGMIDGLIQRVNTLENDKKPYAHIIYPETPVELEYSTIKTIMEK